MATQFSAGWDAYCRGYKASFCPFVVGTARAESWLSGWEAAKAWRRSEHE